MPQWPPGGVIRFGAFEVEPQAGILRKGDARIRLQEQPFQVLLALLEKPGQVITREELHQKVWNGDEFGDLDHRLNIAVNKIREALRDSTENPRFVETLPKRGYRFVATVEDLPKPAPPAVIAGRSYRRFAWTAAGLLALAGGGLWLVRDRAPLPPPRLVPLTTSIGYESAPAFSPDGTHVAFAWNGEKGDNSDIYVKRVGNVTALRLTSDPAGDTLPAWSPDGRQIAFVSRRDGGGIYLVSPEGGPERRVSDLPSDSRPSWAPDGKALLVAKRNDHTQPQPGDGALFLVPVEGEVARRQILAPPRGAWYQDPAFAPDGRSLAFASCPGTSSGPRCSLQVAGLQAGLVLSGKPRQITEQTMAIHGLVWMPDGSSLIYAGHSTEPDSYLWRVNVRNGKEPERLELAGANVEYPAIDFKAGRLAFERALLTHENIWRLERDGKPAPFITSSARDRCPQYSPDGRRIAFASTRQVGNFAIWVANADGTGPAQITGIGNPSGTPRWSPDGRWLAFDAFEKGVGWDVWKVEASGSSPQRLTHGPADNIVPSWSRDGSSIYFASKRSGRLEIWRIPGDGGTAVQITHTGGVTAFESPDGKTLYYTSSEGPAQKLYAKRLPDGEEKQVLNEGIWVRGFAVFSDGVYYIHQLGPRNWQIRFHEFADGRTRVVGEIEGPNPGAGLAVSPDRTTILITKYSSAGTDLMLIENFR